MRSSWSARFDQRVGKDLGVGRLPGRLGLAGLRIVGAQAVKLLLPVERGLKAAAFLRQHVQQHRMVRVLRNLKVSTSSGRLCPSMGPKYSQAELLKQDRGPQHALGSFFGAPRHRHRRLAAIRSHDALGRVVQILVVLVGHDLVEVARNGAHVAVDRPLVVVEHNDQPPGLLGDVVQRLEGDSIGEGGIAGHGNHVLLAAGQIARHGHAQRRGESRSGVPRAEAVVFALGAQHEAVQAARLADRLQAIQPPGEHFVDVSLVADVEEQLVFGGIEDGVQSQCQFDDAEIGTQMAAGLGERLDQEFANLLRQFRHLRKVQALQIGGRVNRLQQCSHVFLPPDKGRACKSPSFRRTSACARPGAGGRSLPNGAHSSIPIPPIARR